jgi:hypothetical protein
MTAGLRSHSAPRLGHARGGRDEHRGDELGVGELADFGQRTPGAVGAENLCHEAIFVDDATRAVMPPDPEMIQVGDVIW